jgi:hypothetical protein
LALPVLAGSAAYALGESFGWQVGLSRRLPRARAFYATILIATLLEDPPLSLRGPWDRPRPGISVSQIAIDQGLSVICSAAAEPSPTAIESLVSRVISPNSATEDPASRKWTGRT